MLIFSPCCDVWYFMIEDNDSVESERRESELDLNMVERCDC